MLLLSEYANSQNIYSVKYKSQSDIAIYVAEYESQCDLKVFKVEYKSQEMRAYGILWSTNLRQI